MSDREELAALTAFAQANGLRFSDYDPFDLSGLPFEIMVMKHHTVNGLPQYAVCDHVVDGVWKDNRMCAFRIDRRFHSPDGGVSHDRHTAVAAPIPVECRIVEIRPAGMLSRATGALGVARHRYESGSRHFDHAFSTTTSDPDFARALLVPPLLEYLLANGRDWHFELASHVVLIHRKQQRHDYEHTAEFLELMSGFYGLIPDELASLHPIGSEPDPELAHRGGAGTSTLAP